MSGCYLDIYSEMEEYVKKRFTKEDPKFLANNFLKNFGKMYQNGERTIDFFND